MSKTKFTFFALLKEFKGKKIEEEKAIDLKNRQIEEMDNISQFKALEKIDLSGNKLNNVEGIIQNLKLKIINLSHNEIQSTPNFSKLSQLTVLNLSFNKILNIDDLTNIPNLKALILNNNLISQISGISKLKFLNTLILSHNAISDISEVSNLKGLTKLNISHNQISDISQIQDLPKLTELRLNDNKVKLIHESVQSLSSLSILDVGNNKLKDEPSIANLQNIVKLKNLNLKGNPLSDQPQLEKMVLKLNGSIEILNNKKLERQDKTHVIQKRKLEEKQTKPIPRNDKDSPEEQKFLKAKKIKAEEAAKVISKPNEEAKSEPEDHLKAVVDVLKEKVKKVKNDGIVNIKVPKEMKRKERNANVSKVDKKILEKALKYQTNVGGWD